MGRQHGEIDRRDAEIDRGAGNGPGPARRSRGQSLAEFALVVPVLLLLTLMAIDFGRVYLGWVNLQNMARIAANFAANNPTAWATNDAAVKAKYQNQIIADAKQNNCTLPLTGGIQTAPDPTFSNPANPSIGDTVQVQLNCTFTIITPVIRNIVGSGGALTVSSSSTFPIKSGMFALGGGGPTAPIAAFTGNPTSVVEGASVSFIDNSSGGPTSWAWTFGDGGTSASQNQVHLYATAGTYTVSLTVTNSVGTSSLTKAGYITVTVAPPAANFTATPLSGNRPLLVTVTDTSTGGPTAWSWTFGDGGTSTAQNPTYSYANAGTYSVSLTVTAPGGTNSVTKTNYITVGAGTCTVPSFNGTSTTTAQATWNAANFTTTVNFQQGNLPWTIKSQTLVGGSSVPCSSSITVSKN